MEEFEMNIKNHFDEFENVKQEFEIIEYRKMADDRWEEHRRFISGSSYFQEDGILYNVYDRTNNSYITLNTDFDAPSYGACFEIGENVQSERKIVGNSVLYSIKYPKDTLTLHKQEYSNGTCFYTLKNSNGNWKVNYGSSDVDDLIEQLNHENLVYSQSVEDYNKGIILEIINANNQMIAFMVSLKLKVVFFEQVDVVDGKDYNNGISFKNVYCLSDDEGNLTSNKFDCGIPVPHTFTSEEEAKECLSKLSINDITRWTYRHCYYRTFEERKQLIEEALSTGRRLSLY